MAITKKVTRDRSRGTELVNALKRQFNGIHSIDHFEDLEIEKLLLQQKQYEVELIENRFNVPNDYPKFSPSGASKCKRELFYKLNKAKRDTAPKPAFQGRWTKNATGVHEQRQRDLLYSEKLLRSPSFLVERMANGLPAWEKNVQAYRLFEHKGQKFYIFGMMDGILKYRRTGSRIGWEFKTKSTKQDAVEKKKGPEPHHKQQEIGYALLFDLKEFLITYESLAKDDWRSADFAIEDLKSFYLEVSEEQKESLLDKYAEVAEAVENGELPPQERSKCLFCPYKTICLEGK